MGTLSTTKILKNLAGTITEFFALTTSAGVADAQAVPALNAAGVLDPSIVNAKIISAGAGDSGKVVQLDASGRIDNSVLPVGLGAETQVMPASEALSAGNFVNIWSNAGVANARKADASVAGKEANGFVLAAFAAATSATVYFASQTNTQQAGLTPGAIHYLSTTPGAAAAAAPTASGNVVQQIGRASTAAVIVFSPGPAITLA